VWCLADSLSMGVMLCSVMGCQRLHVCELAVRLHHVRLQWAGKRGALERECDYHQCCSNGVCSHWLPTFCTHSDHMSLMMWLSCGYVINMWLCDYNQESDHVMIMMLMITITTVIILANICDTPGMGPAAQCLGRGCAPVTPHKLKRCIEQKLKTLN
jgi:hypothetical protein